MTYYLNLCTIAVFEVCCLALFISYSEGSLQDQYIGCYNMDVSSQSNWTNGITDSNTLTIELCIETCNQRRTTYARLQNGRSCLCGDVLDVSSPNYACDTRCSGHNRQICGGPSGAVSSYVAYSVCPVGYYGAGCDKECHCKQQTPCSRISGICPNGCEDSWMLANCSKATSQWLSDRSIGCYLDADERAMEFHSGWFKSTSTVELCSSICAARNYTYVGIEVGAECFCGESYNKYGLLYDSNCTHRCEGDASQFCGGFWALNVFFACPIGYFGNGCMTRCNCKNRERCPCAKCTCSSGCKSGWMGSRCEFRNCLDNNGDCSVNEACVIEDLKFSSITRCNCKQGYQKNQLWDTCSDIDECYLGTHKCDNMTSTCINTLGSYICDCRPGYYRINPTLCQVNSVDVVIVAAIGSGVGLTVIFAIILCIVIIYRRQQKRKQSEDATQIRNKEETAAKIGTPTSPIDYVTLKRNSSSYMEIAPDSSTYLELDCYGNEEEEWKHSYMTANSHCYKDYENY